MARMAGEEKGRIIRFPKAPQAQVPCGCGTPGYATLQLIIDKLVRDVGRDEVKRYIAMELIRVRRIDDGK